MKTVDLNCDLGEGAGQDAELMPLVTSANIACGAHAGGGDIMRATVALALRHGVGIGAHPGFADRGHFGRRELALPPDELRSLVRGQIEALRALAPVRHVKPHGGLYNLAARDRATAEAVAEAVRAVDPALILVGLAGGELLRAGRALGLRVAGEVFADRAYRPDGSLAPRTAPGALIEDPAAATDQVLRLIEAGEADTVCVHGDGPGAAALARGLRRGLAAAGVAFSML